MDCVLRLLLSLNKSRGGGRLNPQMVHSIFGKDKKRLLGPDPQDCWQIAQLTMWERQVEVGMGPGW